VGHEGDLRSIVRAALEEGCAGETVAAVEAAEAAAAATDPSVRAALETIAADERRHALLAFRFVRWALERDGSLVEVVRDELRRARNFAPASDTGLGDLPALGVVGDRMRAEIRRQTLTSVVAPALEALLDPNAKSPHESA
jgi:hypothetical protein